MAAVNLKVKLKKDGKSSRKSSRSAAPKKRKRKLAPPKPLMFSVRALAAMGACQAQIALFVRIFGEEPFELNESAVRLSEAHELNLWWFAMHLHLRRDKVEETAHDLVNELWDGVGGVRKHDAMSMVHRALTLVTARRMVLRGLKDPEVRRKIEGLGR